RYAQAHVRILGIDLGNLAKERQRVHGLPGFQEKLGAGQVVGDGVVHQATDDMQVAEQRVNLSAVRLEFEDFLVDGDGFQVKAVLKEKTGGLVVGVDRFRVGPALEREVPDGVVYIGIVGGLVEKLAPGCNCLGIRA